VFQSFNLFFQFLPDVLWHVRKNYSSDPGRFQPLVQGRIINPEGASRLQGRP
jgi:hypothetical protein